MPSVDESRIHARAITGPTADAGSRATVSLDAVPYPRRGWLARLPIGRLMGYILMVLLVLLIGMPLYWMISGAFKGYAEIRHIPPVWVPHAWTDPTAPKAVGIDNFRTAWNSVPFDRFYLNTFVITFFGTAGCVINATLCAYAFAFLRFPKKDLLFILLLTALMIPGEVTTLPNYIFIGSTLNNITTHLLGVEVKGVNTYWGLVIPTMATAYGTFLVRQGFLSLPREVLEAARLEGAGHLRVLWDIAIPMSRPILITYGLITAVSHWNSFLWPLVITRSEEMKPLTVGIRSLFDNEGNTNYGVVMAATCFVVLPLMLVFIWAQRFIIDGIAAGATKG